MFLFFVGVLVGLVIGVLIGVLFVAPDSWFDGPQSPENEERRV